MSSATIQDVHGRRLAIQSRFGRGDRHGWALSVGNADETTTAPAEEDWSDGAMFGTIKKIEGAKAFGFIAGDDGIDYFFHKTGLAKGVEFHQLREKDRVSFEDEEGGKGPRACEVEPTSA